MRLREYTIVRQMKKKAVLCDLKDVTNSNSQPIAVPVS